MKQSVAVILLLSGSLLFTMSGRATEDFRVLPYVQYPSPEAMTVVWFSNLNQDGSITWSTSGGPEMFTTVTATLATALTYHSVEVPKLPSGIDPGAPYLHRIRLTNLTTDTLYQYTVRQGSSQYSNQFRTSPDRNSPIRFVYYSDSETEPESIGQLAAWACPTTPSLTRYYFVDMDRGYEENLKVMASRSPHFVMIGGDLAESGGEQRDWDEFWRKNMGPGGIIGSTPILPVLGNHEYYGGPGTSLGSYNQPRSEEAIEKYRTYFDAPPNGSPNPLQEKRYYRLDYGPITLLVIDCVNGLPNGSTQDSNYYLLGETEGGNAPDYNPGSRQYQWMEQELSDAQKKSAFTFVAFHHIPYSVGPHGWPAGVDDATHDNQSGTPTRVLLPLFHRYGVDAVLSGHDEMFERSQVEGTETLPDGSTRANTIHIYDVGMGGDGLRGPETGLTNPMQRFLAHTSSPEQWDSNGILVDGGKHYGHLEVNVMPNYQGHWQAILTPVYVFPLTRKNGSATEVTGFERRVYNDEITLTNESFSSVNPDLWMAR